MFRLATHCSFYFIWNEFIAGRVVCNTTTSNPFLPSSPLHKSLLLQSIYQSFENKVMNFRWLQNIKRRFVCFECECELTDMLCILLVATAIALTKYGLMQNTRCSTGSPTTFTFFYRYKLHLIRFSTSDHIHLCHTDHGLAGFLVTLYNSSIVQFRMALEWGRCGNEGEVNFWPNP